MIPKTIEQMQNERYTQIARLFGALNQPERLKIAEILSSRPMKDNILASHLSLPLPQVQGHLQQMVQAGLVCVHTHGADTFYRTDAQALGLLRQSVLQWAQSMQGNHCGCGCH